MHMTPTHTSARVVPWAALPDLAPVAALLRRASEDLRLEIAGLPAGAEGLALLERGRPTAVGLLVLSNVAATGCVSLAWLSAERGASPSSAMRLVEWAEEQVRCAGARSLQVVEKHAAGIGPFLDRRGYLAVNAVVRMRRGTPRRPLPLPTGITEVCLDTATLEAWVGLSNESFEGVPFNAPLSLEEVQRLTCAPEFDARLVRLLVDDVGYIGFLHGTIARDGTGEIEAIGVLPRARGRGLGRWLLRRSEQLLDEEGAREIQLRVAESNDAAMSLYVEEGYVEISRKMAWERVL
jgi:ribosomal protein S18 acetylase RimI-like enzyme